MNMKYEVKYENKRVITNRIDYIAEGRDKETDGFCIRQTDAKSGREYDYSGVLYPEGNLGNETWFLFDDENIAEVYFRGFEDEERTDFLERLSDFYAGK